MLGEAGEDTVEISFLGNSQINDADLISLRRFPSLSQLQLDIDSNHRRRTRSAPRIQGSPAAETFGRQRSRILG